MDIEQLLKRLENALDIIESIPELKEMVRISLSRINEEVPKKTEPKKQMLTAGETADYLGITKSYLYKLTMRKEIPYYKPNGKTMYFDLDKITSWIKNCRISTNKELEEKANTYLLNKKRIKL